MKEMAEEDIVAQWDAVLDRVENGEAIRVVRNGKQIALMLPPRSETTAPATENSTRHDEGRK